MSTRRTFLVLLIPVLILSVIISCKKEDPVVVNGQDYGKLIFKFAEKVNGQPLMFDTLAYTNAAGNQYKVTDIQYFISDITLHNSSGGIVAVTQDNGIHYLDTGIPSTATWTVAQDIPADDYTSVSFTFGITGSKNISNMFVNPPESNMFWPAMMGGGYHYMKLNGEWIDTAGSPRLFNFHMGIGQIYDSVNTDSVIAFVQNYFTATLPASAFTLDSAGTKEIQVVMNVESWFETPNVWDFNFWGGAMMQNQAAQLTAKENGADVFTIGYIH